MSDLQTVAVVGASRDRTKFSNRSLRAHADCGYRVYPINPREKQIEGLEVYARVEDAPVETFDRVTMYVPPAVGVNLLEGIAQKGCGELWLNPGSESPELIAEAERLGLNTVVACSLVDCQSR